MMCNYEVSLKSSDLNIPWDKEQPNSSFETDLILLALPNLDLTKTERTKFKAKNQ